jgi:hypothetical protein
MVRTDASDILEKVDRLERELARAYEEQREAKGQAGDETNIALLRFRARVLSRDIEALRRRKTGSGPRCRRAARAIATRAVGVAFLSGAIAGASALSFAERRAATSRPDPPPPDLPAATSLPPAKADADAGQADADAGQADADAGQADADAGQADADAGQAAQEDTDTFPRLLTGGPPYLYKPVSPRDYDRFLRRSREFFRAIQEHDGPALARLSYPTSGLKLHFEGLRFEPDELRTCFQSYKLYEVPVSINTEEHRRETCGQILDRYAVFARAPELALNEVSEAAKYFSMDERHPYLFFFIPGRDRGHEDLWRGLALVFDCFGEYFEMATVRVAKYDCNDRSAGAPRCPAPIEKYWNQP